MLRVRRDVDALRVARIVRDVKIARSLVALAALCFLAGISIMSSRNPGAPQGMSINDMFVLASIGFLILAGARVLFVTLRRRSA